MDVDAPMMSNLYAPAMRFHPEPGLSPNRGSNVLPQQRFLQNQYQRHDPQQQQQQQQQQQLHNQISFSARQTNPRPQQNFRFEQRPQPPQSHRHSMPVGAFSSMFTGPGFDLALQNTDSNPQAVNLTDFDVASLNALASVPLDQWGWAGAAIRPPDAGNRTEIISNTATQADPFAPSSSQSHTPPLTKADAVAPGRAGSSAQKGQENVSTHKPTVRARTGGNARSALGGLDHTLVANGGGATTTLGMPTPEQEQEPLPATSAISAEIGLESGMGANMLTFDGTVPVDLGFSSDLRLDGSMWTMDGGLSVFDLPSHQLFPATSTGLDGALGNVLDPGFASNDLFGDPFVGSGVNGVAMSARADSGMGKLSQLPTPELAPPEPVAVQPSQVMDLPNLSQPASSRSAVFASSVAATAPASGFTTPRLGTTSPSKPVISTIQNTINKEDALRRRNTYGGKSPRKTATKRTGWGAEATTPIGFTPRVGSGIGLSSGLPAIPETPRTATRRRSVKLVVDENGRAGVAGDPVSDSDSEDDDDELLMSSPSTGNRLWSSARASEKRPSRFRDLLKTPKRGWLAFRSPTKASSNKSPTRSVKGVSGPSLGLGGLGSGPITPSRASSVRRQSSVKRRDDSAHDEGDDALAALREVRLRNRLREAQNRRSLIESVTSGHSAAPTAASGGGGAGISAFSKQRLIDVMATPRRPRWSTRVQIDQQLGLQGFSVASPNDGELSMYDFLQPQSAVPVMFCDARGGNHSVMDTQSVPMTSAPLSHPHLLAPTFPALGNTQPGGHNFASSDFSPVQFPPQMAAGLFENPFGMAGDVPMQMPMQMQDPMQMPDAGMFQQDLTCLVDCVCGRGTTSPDEPVMDCNGCGRMMHAPCCRRDTFPGGRGFDRGPGEFGCPFCEEWS